jgi:hypothetical protein
MMLKCGSRQASSHILIGVVNEKGGDLLRVAAFLLLLVKLNPAV